MSSDSFVSRCKLAFVHLIFIADDALISSVAELLLITAATLTAEGGTKMCLASPLSATDRRMHCCGAST